MKYLSLIAVLYFFASCSTTSTNSEGDNATAEQTAIVDPKNMDPVCTMARDTSWTEYALNGTDTVWFCSAHCKDVYSANPAKYSQK